MVSPVRDVTGTTNMDSLNSILGVEVDEPKTKTVIQQAADIIHGELVVDVPGTNLVVAATDVLVPTKPLLAVHDSQMDALNEDMVYTRVNMKDVIDQAKGALTGALELADSGGEPRAYEVVALMIGEIIKANRELINIHKVRKDAQKTDKETKGTGDTPAQISVQNAIFVGTAQELLRTMKDLEKTTKEQL